MSAHAIVPRSAHDHLNGSTNNADLTPVDSQSLDVSLPHCADWCQLEPGHPDAVDLPLSLHRSTPRLLTPAYGGGRADRSGRATVALQIVQPFSGNSSARIMLAIEINGDEHYAELTTAETETFQEQLGSTLRETR